MTERAAGEPALTATVVMDAPDTRNRLDAMVQGVISKPLDRPDGPLKVSGTAPYAAEYDLAGCAEGVLVLATIAQGTVRNIDRDAVMDMPGVLGVFTQREMLRRPAQGTAGKAPVQDVAKVDYFGQPVALVVAETFEQARAAARALPVTYDDQSADAVLDPENPKAHIDRGEKKATRQGDLDKAMEEAVHAVDTVYRTSGHASAAMEPHASIASWREGELTVHGSFQMLRYNVQELADSLGIEPERVRILAPYVGGGFGSKLGISEDAVAAAIAARELNRPVRVVLSRQQVFQAIIRRSETRQHLRLAADAQGKLTGIGQECLVSNLPGESFAEPVVQATTFLYGGANRILQVDTARVSLMTAGSVRAPGEAVGMPVLEAAMDELAEKVGIDPVELRKRNIPERHPSRDIPFSSHSLAEALDAGARQFGWEHRAPKPCQRREGEWWIGMGMASAARVNLLMGAEARVTLRPDGHVLVESDQTDIGTGSYAIFGQIAGEMLGAPIDRVEVRLGDTALPAGAGSGGSWGAASTGSAVFEACQQIRKRIAEQLGCEEEELTMRDGVATAGNRRHPVGDLLGETPLEAVGTLKPGKMGKEFAQASYGAFFAEVAVNAYTGEVRVRRMTGAFGIGRVLNEKTARSQCLGGMIWGIGTALTESLEFDTRSGLLANHDLAEYHVPVNLDVPEIDVLLLEERDPAANPLQAKGVGELGTCGAAGAVANAIYNACGVRLRDFPFTPDKVIAELPAP